MYLPPIGTMVKGTVAMLTGPETVPEAAFVTVAMTFVVASILPEIMTVTK